MKKRIFALVMVAFIVFCTLSIGAGAAEVGFIPSGASAMDFKLYDTGEDVFGDIVPRDIINHTTTLDYNQGFVVDKADPEAYHPVTGDNLASWVNRKGIDFVYIPELNPSVPNAHPNANGAERHNYLYLYHGTLPEGDYILRSSSVYPEDPLGHTRELPSEYWDLRCLVYSVDSIGATIPDSKKYYIFPQDGYFHVEPGQKVILYYYFKGVVKNDHELGLRYYFAQKPQLYHLTEITPTDFSDKETTWHQLLEDFKWESYNAGYKIAYDEGIALAELRWKEGYNLGYDKGNTDGYESGYNKGHTSGWQSGNTVGYNNGLADGYDGGYNDGYTKGNDEGYRRGVKELDTAGGVVGGFVESAWDVLVDGVTIVSDGTTVNGISLLGIFFTVIGIAVVVLVLRLIRR